MATLVQEKAAKLAAKQKEMAAVLAQYPDLNVPSDKSADFASDVKQRNDELADLGKELDGLREIERIAVENQKAMAELDKPVHTFGHSAGVAPQAAERKSLGELFVASKAFKEYHDGAHRGPIDVVQLDVKTTMTESAGFAPQAIRTGQVIESAQQQPKIIDIIPSVTTTMNAVVYMRETTFTNNAAEASETGAYGEAALAYTEETDTIRKIAVFLPVTDEQLADVPAMQQRINNRLMLMLRQRLDSQIVSGDGNAPNLRGLAHVASTQTQAKAADSNVDAIYKGITLLRSIGFVEPNALLLNPTDWQNIRLLKTSIGSYLFGDPGMVGIERVWGLPVVQSTYVSAGTAWTGDFAGYSEMSYKAGIEFEISNSHSDYFTKGQLAVRAQLRCAFSVLRPTAFLSVTGL